MMSKFKKTMSVFMAAVLTTGVIMSVPVASAAETEVEVLQEGNFSYILLEDGTAQITDYTGEEADVVIPSEIGGAEVTSIGEKAFYAQYDIESIEIPDSVISIGVDAFSLCHKVESFYIPKNVAYIGERAFYYNKGFKEFVVSEENEYFDSVDGVLFTENAETLVCYPTAKADKFYQVPDTTTTILQYSFGERVCIEELIIPDNVTEIGWGAFSGLKQLRKVEIGDGLKEIKVHTFNDCQRLESVKIGNSVTSIGYSAFECCYNLETVVFGDSVEYIGHDAFKGCNDMITVSLPPTVKEIGSYAFGKYYTIVDSFQMTEYIMSDFSLYGYEGTAAETYMDGQFFKPVSPRVLSESTKQVTVKCDTGSDVNLNVADVSTNLDNVVASYNIILKNSYGYKVQPYGDITISIPCETEDCEIVKVENDGTFKMIEAEYVDNKYTFVTDTLGTYVIVTEYIEPEKVFVGDVNIDGLLDVNDVTYLQMHLAGYMIVHNDFGDNSPYLDMNNTNDFERADVNVDNTIDVNDVTTLQMKLAGYEI